MKSKIKQLKSVIIIIVCGVLLTLFFGTSLVSTLVFTNAQHFSNLAHSFLNGKTYFLENYGPVRDISDMNDVIEYGGYYYWPEGPFPAVLLMPFIFVADLFGVFFYQSYLQIFLVMGVFAFSYKISKKLGYSSIDSIFSAIAFCIGSMLIGLLLNSSSWYFSQVVSVFLLLFAIWEYFNKKRYWLIGIIFGVIFLTRITVAINIIFFVLTILFFDKQRKQIVKILQLTLPVLIAVLVLMTYNYTRFGDPLEQGYSICNLGSFEDQNTSTNPLLKAREYGMMGLIHVPGNLYYAFLAVPRPVFKDGISHVLKAPFVKLDPWGMSIFLTSPYLLALFFMRSHDKRVVFMWATVVAVAISVFLYCGIGFYQFGYRYGADFMPFLWLIFLINYKNSNKYFSDRLKLLLSMSAFLNIYLYLCAL